MSTLIDNLNSEYLGASRFLYSRRAPKHIYVYVESYDDIPFWKSLFANYEGDKLYFEIMIPSATSLVKGKKKVMELIPSSGKYLILCVDSDYDYLLRGATDISEKINKEKYVFQTYTYSIENYYCLAERLQLATTQAMLNDKRLVDWCEIFRHYSKITYKLFLWSVCFYKMHRETDYPIHRFCSIISLPEKVDILNIEQVFNRLTLRVEEEILRLKQIYPEYISFIPDLGRELRMLGLFEDNTYLFIHGHTIMNNVVLKLITPVCNKLKKERIDEINAQSKNEEDRNNNMQYYHRNIRKIEDVLKQVIECKSAELYLKIQNDICQYIKDSF